MAVRAGTSAATTHRDTDIDNTAQALKVSGGELYRLADVQNPNSADAWLHFYDATAANVTVGTTVPKLSFVIPANGARSEDFSADPIRFSTAITYAATTTAAGGTDPTTGLVGNLFYR